MIDEQSQTIIEARLRALMRFLGNEFLAEAVAAFSDPKLSVERVVKFGAQLDLEKSILLIKAYALIDWNIIHQQYHEILEVYNSEVFPSTLQISLPVGLMAAATEHLNRKTYINSLPDFLIEFLNLPPKISGENPDKVRRIISPIIKSYVRLLDVPVFLGAFKEREKQVDKIIAGLELPRIKKDMEYQYPSLWIIRELLYARFGQMSTAELLQILQKS